MGDRPEPHHLAQHAAARAEQMDEIDDREPWPTGADPVTKGSCSQDRWRGCVTRAALDAVMARVDQAFSGVPEPASTEAFTDGGGEHLAARWRAVVADQGWSAVSALVDRDAFYLGWLRPEAWRYVLPQVLRGCLYGANGGDDGGANNSSQPEYNTYWNAIEPRDEAALRCGHDPLLTAGISLLTPEQRAAVCDVLGLRLRAVVGPGDPVTRPYLAGGVVEAAWASDPLRLGWRSFDHPAVELAAAVRRRWTTFVWPDAETQPERELIAQVRAAFADRPRPAEPLADSDDYETVDNALALAGTDWRYLHPELLHWAYTALTFLDNEAACYYLPAFLIGDVMGVGPSPLSYLESIVGPTSSYAPFVRAKNDLLRPAERAAVVAYLRHGAARSDYERVVIEVALAEYWLPGLDAQPPSIESP